MVVASADAPPEPDSAAGERSLRKDVRKLSSVVMKVEDDDDVPAVVDERVDAGEGEGEGPDVELKSG